MKSNNDLANCQQSEKSCKELLLGQVEALSRILENQFGWEEGTLYILCTAVASLTTMKVFFSNNRTLRHAVKIRLYDSLRADTQARQESNQPNIHE